MEVVIRERLTGYYLVTPAEWTLELMEAKVFSTTERAAAYCLDHQVVGAQLISSPAPMSYPRKHWLHHLAPCKTRSQANRRSIRNPSGSSIPGSVWVGSYSGGVGREFKRSKQRRARGPNTPRRPGGHQLRLGKGRLQMTGSLGVTHHSGSTVASTHGRGQSTEYQREETPKS